MRTEAGRSSRFDTRQRVSLPIALLKGQRLKLRAAHQTERVQQAPTAMTDDLGQATPGHAHTSQAIGLLNTAR